LVQARILNQMSALNQKSGPPLVQIELSVLVRQCLKRRLPDVQTLRREAEAWEEERNRAGASVNWRFTTADARTKLRKLYPSIEL
jgi:hypothetical protein